MKPTVLVAGVLAILLLPMIAIATVAGSIIPAATSATTCADPTVVTAGGWRAPLNGRYVVTSGFGTRYHPILHTTKLHTGIDLVATGNKIGDKTVIAAAAGTVTTRGFNTAYGNQIVLDQGNGTQTRYAHMAHPSPATVGQKVPAGTTLGIQGATGFVTGAHLHFEVIQHGRPINPKPFMAAHGAPLNGGKVAGDQTPTLTVTKSGVTSPSNHQAASLTATRTDGRTVKLDAAQLTNATTIIGIARRTGAGQRGATIALMAALQESTLRNLDYGDRDSLGLFQQREGWGSAAQRRNPDYATRAFFGGPNGPNHGHPAGLLDTSGWRSMQLGEAAQAVQVSAFPDAYDAWEPVAIAILNQTGESAHPSGCTAGSSAYGHLQVATWNLCLEFCGHGKLRPWRQRIAAIAADIRTQRPDVVALQETGKKATQGAAIISALAPQYRLAVYKRSKMVLFNPAVLADHSADGRRLRATGFVVHGKGGVAATLRDKRTGKTVIVSSIHPNDGTDDTRRLHYIRVAHQKVLDLQRSSPGSVIIHAGDLNSYIPETGTRKNVAHFFTDRGYRTAEQVAKYRTGQQYRSYNGGHPPTRGPRIDHVVIKPADLVVNTWRLILPAHSSNPDSDHNMIVVDLSLTDPPSRDTTPDAQEVR